MLTSLRIQNFKCWRDTGEMRLAPITGLFGANSSGKTSILQFLLMLKQTVESSDRAQIINFGSEKDYVQLGNFRDIAYKTQIGEQADTLQWTLQWLFPHPIVITDRHGGLGIRIGTGRENMQYQANLSIEQAGNSSLPILSIKKLQYEQLLLPTNEPIFISLEHTAGDVYRLIFDTQDQKGDELIELPVGSFSKFYTLSNLPNILDEYFRPLTDLKTFGRTFEEVLSLCYYLGPLRDYPRREYLWTGNTPADVGKRGEQFAAALLNSQLRGDNIEIQVAGWLKKLGLIHNFAMEEIAAGSSLYQVRIQQTEDTPFVKITEVGFGVSQVLPVLTLCYYVPEGSVIIFEQPEIHLHPKVQAGLADVFIDVAKKRNIQIILESHSEHLLTRLQRRIAENTLTEQSIAAEDVALYFCKREGAEARLEPLELNEFGYITNWPDDFFRNEMEERSAMMEAAIERQQKGEAA